MAHECSQRIWIGVGLVGVMACGGRVFAQGAPGRPEPRPMAAPAGATNPVSPPSLGKNPQPQQIKAVKHLDMVNAALQSARVNAQALYDMSASPQAFDKAHARIFADQIRADLQRATEHLGHLQGLATGRLADASQPIEKTRNDLQRAMNEIPQLSDAVKANEASSVNQATSSLASDVQGAWDDYKNVADRFGYDAELKSP